jgi:hypothetical protein
LYANILCGILILPNNLSNRAEARALDVFIAAGLTITGELYEWNTTGSWIRRPFPPPPIRSSMDIQQNNGG